MNAITTIEAPKVSYDGENAIPLNTPIDQVDVQLLRFQPTYKPFHYPWAERYEDDQQSVHWVPREVPMGEDLKDWAIQSERLTDAERALLMNIFRLFTQSDIDVADNYMDQLTKIFKNGEVRRMLMVFGAFETIHIKAYSYVLESLKLPDSVYHEFLDIEEMREKHDWLKSYKGDTLHGLLITLAVFSSFVEGLQLFASFAMLMNFPRFGLMRGMGQIVTWSIRDETIHVKAGQRLYHALLAECGIPSIALAPELQEAARYFVRMEDAFIDKAFEVGEIRGATKQQFKDFVRYVADIRLMELEVEPIFNIEEHPIPWFDEQTGHEHANFFETRATEYSKAAYTKTWPEAWEALDRNRDRQIDASALVDSPGKMMLQRRIQSGLVDPVLPLGV
jgi:ribonucleoside-diphosphate reductase beta chain